MKRSRPAREQPLLDPVLHAARRELALRRRRQLLAQPRYRPIEVVQAQIGRARDGVVDHPLLARAVRTGDEQPVQHADEDRPLEGELEAAAIHELVHHAAQPQPLPEPPEQQGPADADAGEAARLHVRQHHRPLGMACQRGDQPVELAARVEDVLAAKRADGALAYPLSLPDALHEVEISMTAGDLLADGQTRHSVLRYFNILVDTDSLKSGVTVEVGLYGPQSPASARKRPPGTYPHAKENGFPTTLYRRTDRNFWKTTRPNQVDW